ncbi:uncharacterized protein [Clytia hemisphaerica]|uniref:uncharacterized protein isoform X3 n=1 Tax=Clytia hemisphaerica TaxID=252671 RepID=UPI0034D49697
MAAEISKRVIKKIVNVKETEDGQKQFEVEWQNTWETEEALKALAQSSELIEKFLKGQCEENNNSIIEPNEEPIAQTNIADDNKTKDVSKTDSEPTTTNSIADDDDEEDGLQIDEQSMEIEETAKEPALSDLFSSPPNKKAAGKKGINAIISRLQKTQQKDYVAKTPLSPTAACEAPEGMLPTSNATSQLQSATRSDSRTHSQSSSPAPPMAATSALSIDLNAGGHPLKTTQSYELIQRLPSGVTTVVRNLPPGTVFYEPGQMRTGVPPSTSGQPTILQHFHQPNTGASVLTQV